MEREERERKGCSFFFFSPFFFVGGNFLNTFFFFLPPLFAGFREAPYRPFFSFSLCQRLSTDKKMSLTAEARLIVKVSRSCRARMWFSHAFVHSRVVFADD